MRSRIDCFIIVVFYAPFKVDFIMELWYGSQLSNTLETGRCKMPCILFRCGWPGTGACPHDGLVQERFEG